MPNVPIITATEFTALCESDPLYGAKDVDLGAGLLVCLIYTFPKTFSRMKEVQLWRLKSSIQQLNSSTGEALANVPEP